MTLRTALGLTALIIVIKAVLIGLSWRGRCALMQQCDSGVGWYPAVIAVVGLVIIGAVFAAYHRGRQRGQTRSGATK